MNVSIHTYKRRKPYKRKMLEDKYYSVISKILNNELSVDKFNYGRLMDISYYLYHNYTKRSNLETYVKYLKKWGFVRYKQGGQYPFNVIRHIPMTLVPTICKNPYMNKEEREELVQEHYKIMRKEKIEKIKNKINETIILQTL